MVGRPLRSALHTWARWRVATAGLSALRLRAIRSMLLADVSHAFLIWIGTARERRLASPARHARSESARLHMAVASRRLALRGAVVAWWLHHCQWRRLRDAALWLLHWRARNGLNRWADHADALMVCK